jgi:hypothetical protein
MILKFPARWGQTGTSAAAESVGLHKIHPLEAHRLQMDLPLYSPKPPRAGEGVGLAIAHVADGFALPRNS